MDVRENKSERRVTKSLLCVAWSVVVLVGSGFADECPIPEKTKTKTTDPVPLCLVAKKIKQALDDYNADPKALRLSAAEFDFKTVRSTSGGFSFSILVFKVGATHQVDSTDDVTFSYAVPAKPKSETEFALLKENPDFSKELVQTIRDAAKQLASTESVGDAKFKALTINLAYAVKWDFSAGVTIPVQLVTLGGTFDRNKSTTQSVKLTFGDSSK